MSRLSQTTMQETCSVSQKMISFRWWVAQKEKNDQSIDCESSRWVLWTGSGYTTTCTWGQLLPGGFSAQSSPIFLRHLDLDATMYSREIICLLSDWSFTSPNVGRPSSAPSFSLKSLLPSSSQAWRSFCRLVILACLSGEKPWNSPVPISPFQHLQLHI